MLCRHCSICSVKIYSTHPTSQQSLGWEISLLSKMLRFCIRILLVPVSISQDGEYKLKFRSKRFFFSWLLWILTPSVLLGYFFYTSLVQQIDNINKDSGFQNVSDIVFYQLDLINYLLAAWILPAGTGHLVSQFHSKDLLKFPIRKLGVFLCIIFNLLLHISYLMEEGGERFYIFLVSFLAGYMWHLVFGLWMFSPAHSSTVVNSLLPCKVIV